MSFISRALFLLQLTYPSSRLFYLRIRCRRLNLLSINLRICYLRWVLIELISTDRVFRFEILDKVSVRQFRPTAVCVRVGRHVSVSVSRIAHAASIIFSRVYHWVQLLSGFGVFLRVHHNHSAPLTILTDRIKVFVHLLLHDWILVLGQCPAGIFPLGSQAHGGLVADC